MVYIMRIDTTKYKDHKNISRKNWEPGTMDDYMHAINGFQDGSVVKERYSGN